MEQISKWMKRSSGVLLPVSSLPSDHGIGSLGDIAYKWIDFLCNAKQSYWQILPLSPTSFGDSPYQSFSAFAGNPYFIELDALRDEGLLKSSDYDGIIWGKHDNYVDYAALYENREKVLFKAFLNFTENNELDDFIDQNDWLSEYGLFMVIKALNDGKSWTEWSEPLRKRNTDELDKIKKEHDDKIRFQAFLQYKFHNQWKSLRNYANERGIQIIGDIPIYVSLDSSDVWANPEMYQLDENNLPGEVSGCPPDSFAADGQLWGNPLYNWDKMKDSGYKWWIKRFEKNFELYDVIRLDHFRGLESYFAIPYGDETAARGVWKQGPGKGFLDAIKENLPDAKIIAEDLGYLTNEVYELLAYSGYPGMKITQYAFDNREAGDYLPYNYGKNSVVYPGTHDNDTLTGWVNTAPADCINDALLYTATPNKNMLPGAMIRLTLQSAPLIAVIPVQDWLGLGSKSRINIPSTVGGNNWRWRLNKKDINNRLAGKIAEMTAIYRRA
ncbi:MAG: 4-alpha-glucanotransferase [Oscillospiraceae bacterium]|nr:4-alpha-glucanotransferase [Oscillospiraceae bacterium]